MADINLIAMKEQERANENSWYILYILTPIILSVFLIFIAHYYYWPLIISAKTSNAVTTKQITFITSKLIDKKVLESDKVKLQEIINSIQKMDGARYDMVQILKIITKLTPEKAFLMTLENKDEHIKISGQTRSKKTISELLKRLSEISFISKPHLSRITTNRDSNVNNFKINFTLSKAPPFYTINKVKK